MHVQLRVQNVGWSADLERWDRGRARRRAIISDGSDDEDVEAGELAEALSDKALLRLMA